MQINTEDGETAGKKLKKLIEGKQYKPELPPGHQLTMREAKRIRFNKAKTAPSKKGDELELPHSTPLQIPGAPDLPPLPTNPHQSADPPTISSTSPSPRSESPDTIPLSNPGQPCVPSPAASVTGPPSGIRKLSHHKPSQRFLEYLADLSEDPEGQPTDENETSEGMYE